jgi:F0F1-type ATP synthase membrane subunit a
MIILGDVFLIANLFPLAILFVLTFLELAVAIIQSYIFTILTCIYLKDIFVAH